MPEADLLQLFVYPLNEVGITYLVSGSMAAMLYGEPRVTHDVDLVVFFGRMTSRSSHVHTLRETRCHWLLPEPVPPPEWRQVMALRLESLPRG